MAFDDPNDILLIDYRGIEYYKSDIDIICNEYIDSLEDPSMIYRSIVFSGLLQLIYKRVLKNVISNNEHIDYTLLNDIFYNLYIPLCNKYNIAPSIIQFTSMCRISYDSINNNYKGIRTDGGKANKKNVEIVKNWHDFIESGYLSKAVNEASIGSIFALKAIYKYRDTSTVEITQGTLADHDTPEMIAERHKGAKIPEKPEI